MPINYESGDVGKTSGSLIFDRERTASLFLRPTIESSVAMQVCQQLDVGNSASGQRGRVKLAAVKPLDAASWVSEGSEIPVSNPQGVEINVDLGKAAALAVYSSEFGADSEKWVLQQVGQSLVRQTVSSIDGALFGSPGGAAPAGLNAVTTATVDNANRGNLDWAAVAMSLAEARDTKTTAFVAHPDDVLSITTLKESDTSNRGLLVPDATAPGVRTVAGVPLHSSSAVAPGTVWAIPKDRVVAVFDGQPVLASSADAKFTSDEMVLRSTLRCGFGVLDPLAVAKITFGA